MSINLLEDLGFDEQSPEVQNARFATEMYAEVIDELVKCRLDSGLNQTEVAVRMRTSQSAVSEFESANADARFSTLLRYAHAVDCRIVVEVERRQTAGPKSWVNLLIDDDIVIPFAPQRRQALRRDHAAYTVDWHSFQNYEAAV